MVSAEEQSPGGGDGPLPPGHRRGRGEVRGHPAGAVRLLETGAQGQHSGLLILSLHQTAEVE